MIAILCAARLSAYRALPDLDIYDAKRGAENYHGPHPIVAHPPCSQWGRLRHFARPDQDAAALAPWCVELAREYGGIVEHPAHSRLWRACALPRPGDTDQLGGWTLAALQSWWGCPAAKPTWFYIVGLAPRELPTMPYSLNMTPAVIGRSTNRAARAPEVQKSRRAATPPALAAWLVTAARTIAANRNPQHP